MKYSDGYQITHKDFLVMSVELEQEIFLCEQEKITSPNVDLGIKSTYRHLCKKILGFIIDQVITIPTKEGVLMQDKEIIAKISCSSLSSEEITPQSRILFNGRIFRFEEKATYTHRRVNVYKELRLYKNKEVERENVFINEEIKKEEEGTEENYPSNIWELLE